MAMHGTTVVPRSHGIPGARHEVQHYVWKSAVLSVHICATSMQDLIQCSQLLASHVALGAPHQVMVRKQWAAILAPKPAFRKARKTPPKAGLHINNAYESGSKCLVICRQCCTVVLTLDTGGAKLRGFQAIACRGQPTSS